jgi:Uma2 family endonuclease
MASSPLIEAKAAVAYAMDMSAAPRMGHVTVDDYLAGELASDIKHEYLGGFVYAMAGGRNVHNLIASNVLGALHMRLRGKPCRTYNSDTKIRVQLPTYVGFYYPDTSVICDPNPPDDLYQERPVLIAEVLSRNTRRTDQGEKKNAYLSIPTLLAYLLIEQDGPNVIVYRRTEHAFIDEMHTELDAVISLMEIGAELPLAEIYEGVEFMPEPDEDR